MSISIYYSPISSPLRRIYVDVYYVPDTFPDAIKRTGSRREGANAMIDSAAAAKALGPAPESPTISYVAEGWRTPPGKEDSGGLR